MVRVTKALALVGAISMALSLPVAAADRPVVLQVIGVKVTGDMAGAQAQVMSAAQMSLWTRTRGLRRSEVE